MPELSALCRDLGRRSCIALVVTAAMAVATPTHAAPLDGWRIQPPTLAAPERGSVAGPLSGTKLDAAGLAQGSFELPWPFPLPVERGAPLVEVLPRYSPDHGLSEWGMGWSVPLSIVRSRLSGHVDYRTDDLSGPWGRMVKGADGAWYPVGLTAEVRVVESGVTLIAYLPEGLRLEFGGDARETTAAGTFGWYITSASSPWGHRASFDWTITPGERPRLDRVRYGGRGSEHTAELRVAYAPIAVERATIDRRSGEARRLAARVERLELHVRDPGTNAWIPRWTQTLRYVEDVGVAFYLQSVSLLYSSGVGPPPVTYSYDLPSATWREAALSRNAGLDPVLAEAGLAALSPERSTLFDLEDDGRPDLELADDGTAWVRRDDGFERRPFAATGDIDPLCRPPASPTNAPRILARLAASDAEPSILAVTAGDQPMLHVCARTGAPRAAPSSLGVGWALGPVTRIADVDGDWTPDMLHVGVGRASVRIGRKTAGLALGAAIESVLEPPIEAEAAWALDLTGDGLADLVVESGLGLWVWPGVGHGRFERSGQRFRFLDASRQPFEVEAVGQAFLDANHDGLQDLLLLTAQSAFLLVNDGAALVYQPVPALADHEARWGVPLDADLSGSGEHELTVVRGTPPRAHSLALSRPSTGLLTGFDDGQGTRAAYTYGRAPAAPAGTRRAVVLDHLVIERAGEPPIEQTFAYGAPRIHPIGRFLLGYRSVQRTGPGDQSWVEFVDDDRYARLTAFERNRDRAQDGVDAWRRFNYAPASVRGTNVLRLTNERAGRGPTNAAPATTTTYEDFADGRCARNVSTVRPAGTLVTRRRFATPAALAQHLTCIVEATALSGRHGDSSLDFGHEVATPRNATGQIVTVAAGSAAQTIQRATYRPDGSLETLKSAGEGTSTFTYDSFGVSLLAIERPDGVRVAVTERDPLTTQPRGLETRRGDLLHTQSFRFDAAERLERTWDENTSAIAPEMAFVYRLATTERPGAVTELLRRDDDHVGTHVQLVDPAGQVLADLSKGELAWSVGAVTRRVPGEGLFERRMSGAGLVADPATLRYADLARLGDWVERTRSGPAGEYGAEKRLHRDVTRTLQVSRRFVAGSVAIESRENGTLVTRSVEDGEGRRISLELPSGALYRYTWDALGRLRKVRMPDQTELQFQPDPLGRIAASTRTDGAGVRFAYDGDGLLAKKSFVGGQAVRRTQAFARDAVGRVSEETHRDTATGASAVFRRYYDGARPGAPADRELGLETGVSGPGFAKRRWHRADGRLVTEELELTGVRTLRVEHRYFGGGEHSGRTVTLLDPSGGVLRRARFDYGLDAFGRVNAILIDGVEQATIAYTPSGHVARVGGPGQGRTLDRDPLTLEAIGASDGQVRLNSVRWGDRGYPITETLGAKELRYDYWPDGQLRSVEGDHREVYRFDAVGRPLGAGLDATPLDWSHSTLRAGGVQYQFDALQRPRQVGGTTIAWGPDGQITTATNAARSRRYLHDESGLRIAAFEDGQLVTGRLGDVGFTQADLFLPLRLEGGLIARWDGGHLEWTSTDAHGSIEPVSAFGPGGGSRHRAWLDFHGEGYDDVLGTIRMGARDYDPRLGAFWTLDPKFLEDFTGCVTEPLQCNLRTYALGNPASYGDPTGLDVFIQRDTSSPSGHTNIVVKNETGMYSIDYASWRWIEMNNAGSSFKEGRMLAEGEHTGAIAVRKGGVLHYKDQGYDVIRLTTTKEQDAGLVESARQLVRPGGRSITWQEQNIGYREATINYKMPSSTCVDTTMKVVMDFIGSQRASGAASAAARARAADADISKMTPGARMDSLRSFQAEFQRILDASR